MCGILIFTQLSFPLFVTLHPTFSLLPPLDHWRIPVVSTITLLLSQTPQRLRMVNWGKSKHFFGVSMPKLLRISEILVFYRMFQKISIQMKIDPDPVIKAPRKETLHTSLQKNILGQSAQFHISKLCSAPMAYVTSNRSPALGQVRSSKGTVTRVYLRVIRI